MIFKQVAELQSISKAAAKLGYVQSNISGRIKSLEEELGVKLLVRSNRGVTLTDKGNVLLEYANQIILLMDEVKTSVNPHKWRATLIIGAPQSISAVKIPELFSSFLKRYEHIDVKVRTSDKQKLLEMLFYGEIDGLFVNGPYDEASFESVFSYDQKITLIKPKHWELETPYNQTLIVNSYSSCSYRNYLLSFSEEHHFNDPTIMELDSLESILQAVQDGLGISILPEDIINRRPDLHTIECQKLSESIKIIFIVKQKKQHSRILKDFVRFLKETL